jgi:endo-1,3(4)-beta-glucanase
MLPVGTHSGLTRAANFVTEEWNTYFSNGRVDAINSGWKGILYANLALVDPKTAWTFFAQPGWQDTWLDGGASRSWYLAMAAALGGA